MTGTDRHVLLALQALVLGVPLLIGGMADWTVPLAVPIVLALLAVTIAARRQRPDALRAPGVAMLAAFLALGLATTVPLPPALLAALSPATAQLYTDMLPGWPGGGGWSVWHALAIDPYGVWVELCRLSIGFGVFTVVVAYPWRANAWEGDPRTHVLGRMLLTLIAGGVLFFLLALMQDLTGTEYVLWITDSDRASPGHASGPFVNPNHFAAWLEMVIPVTLGYVLALGACLQRRIRRAANTGQRMGVRARRAWIAALITNQRRLWPPLVAVAALLALLVGHVATGSRGGMAALLVGLAVAGTGATATARTRTSAWPRLARFAPAVIGLTLVLASVASLAAWVTADSGAASSAVESVDVSLSSRLGVASAARSMVRDHPLFGTGLGSFLHAFRPYQAPPVEGGIWSHAHNDYLELLSDSGVLGAAIAALFAVALLRAHARARRARQGERTSRRGGRRQSDEREESAVAGSADGEAEARPPGFELPEWRVALDDKLSFLRWGLAGSVAAILVHSFVDFGLRMPANSLTVMLILALLVLTERPRPAGRTRSLGLLLALSMVAFAPLVTNAALLQVGAMPLAPADCLDSADLLYAEEGPERRDDSLALIHRALDRSPADGEAHEALAYTLGRGPEGDDALRRAIALSPWAPEARDELALRLWERGDHAAAAVEIEESIYRFPYLVSHAYLSPYGTVLAPRDNAELLRALADGDTLIMRLGSMDEDMAAAIERGLRRALEHAPLGAERGEIVNDLVAVLEVRGRWKEAAGVLATESELSFDGGGYLARAARVYMKAGNHEAAEKMLLAALLQTPEQGDLYRELAVEIYAARGDFDTAEVVLEAGGRHAVDMLPVYRATTEVLAKRELAWSGKHAPGAVAAGAE